MEINIELFPKEKCNGIFLYNPCKRCTINTLIGGNNHGHMGSTLAYSDFPLELCYACGEKFHFQYFSNTEFNSKNHEFNYFKSCLNIPYLLHYYQFPNESYDSFRYWINYPLKIYLSSLGCDMTHINDYLKERKFFSNEISNDIKDKLRKDVYSHDYQFRPITWNTEVCEKCYNLKGVVSKKGYVWLSKHKNICHFCETVPYPEWYNEGVLKINEREDECPGNLPNPPWLRSMDKQKSLEHEI